MKFKDGWYSDNNGNRCSVAYFGGHLQARRALRSLLNCESCENCDNCTNCVYCWRCHDCHDCSCCWRCSTCAFCVECWDCSHCSDCSDCRDCSDCQKCLGGTNFYENCEATSFPEIPKIPNIHNAVYEAASRSEALDMSEWHTCDTTHCRAGWVVTLARKAGRVLEDRCTTELAAMLIYRESSHIPVSPARFYDSDEAALADMKRLAELEAGS